MFQSAKDLATTASGDDDIQEEGDDWFTAPPPPGAVLGFQSAKKVVETDSAPADDSMGVDENPFDDADASQSDVTPVFVGFQTSASLLSSSKPSKKTSWSVSAEALAKAAERMKRWEAEIDKELVEPSAQTEAVSPLDLGSVSQPVFERVVLKDVENSSVVQPSSQSLSQPEPPDTPTPVRTASKPPSSTGFASTSRKPFKSPLMTRPTAGPSSGPSTPSFSSPLNPRRTSSGFKPPSFTTPLKPAFASTSTSASPAGKSLGMTPRRAVGSSPLKKPGFTTPFKPGMRPGEPGRAQLEATEREVVREARTPLVVGNVPSVFKTPAKDKGKGRATFFDLSE